jgi:hypothetical protein
VRDEGTEASVSCGATFQIRSHAVANHFDKHCLACSQAESSDARADTVSRWMW